MTSNLSFEGRFWFSLKNMNLDMSHLYVWMKNEGSIQFLYEMAAILDFFQMAVKM